MEDWNGTVMSKRSGFGGIRSSMRDVEDFEEEEIWDSVKDIDIIQDDYSSPKMRKQLISGSASSSTWLNISTNTAPRIIPRRGNNTTKTTNNEAKLVVVQQSSAPMEIPDWSKIYGKSTSNDHHGHGYGDDVDYDDVNDDDDDDDDDDGDDDDMVPPHEWIAKKLARSQISSFSVCEGIGRTLKGRDLSKVRNAILTKTGFLE